MKKLSLLLFTFLLFATISVFAQKDNGAKYISGEYKFSGKNIRINATNRNIILESWKEQKIKIVTGNVNDNENNEPESELLERMGITVHEMNSSINISVKEGSYSINYGSSSNSNNSSTAGSFVPLNSKKNITIYLPKSAKIAVDVKYANLTCKNSFDALDVDITNSNFDLESANELKLVSKYGNSSVGEIKSGEIDFINGNLSINTIEEGDIDTKYANIELGSAKKITFVSTNDEYEIDHVGDISGRKNYGSLRIGTLDKSIDLSGTNSDVKIKKIESTVSSIKMDNKYANLRLPLKSIKDYSIEIKGNYNSVFSDNSNTDINNVSKSEEENVYSAISGKGNATKIAIKCQNCTVDLK
jgi:hypothetical protein